MAILLDHIVYDLHTFFIDKTNFKSLFCHDIDIAENLFPNEADTASTAVSVKRKAC
jgi:hypothetical protein